MKTEVLLSLRYLARSGRIAPSFFLTAISVAMLVLIGALLAGFDQALIGKLLLATPPISCQAPEGGGFDAATETARRITAASGVSVAVPRFATEVLASTRERSAGCRLIGLEGTREARLLPFLSERYLASLGRWAGGGPAPLLVGAPLFARLSLALGDTISVSVFSQNAEFRVIGTFEIGLGEYDTAFLYAPIEALRALADFPDGATEIAILPSLPDREDEIAATLRVLLPRAVFPTWKERNAALLAALRFEKTMVTLAGILVLLLSAFAVGTLFATEVLRRSREIGVLFALGMTPDRLRNTYLLSALLLSLAATATGILGGAGIALALERQALALPADTAAFYGATALPVRLDLASLLVPGLLAPLFALVSTLVAIVPRLRDDPVDLLRAET